MKKLLEQKFPGAAVSNVSKSAYFGLYEAQFDEPARLHRRPKVAYVLVGSIYDANTKQNLTEDRLRKLNRVAWDSLPFELAIKKVKGNGTRKLAIFSDADCPFCARLEDELKGVDDVTIYTFLYPIDQLHPDAARKSKIIWCSPDRQKAWDEFFASGKLPDNKGDCDTPLAATRTLGEKLRVDATPTLVFADGSIVPGALPRAARGGDRASARAEADAARRGEEVTQRRPRHATDHLRASGTTMAIIDFLQETVHRHHRVDRRLARHAVVSGSPTRTRKSRTARSSIVRESQVAQFVYLGEFGDTFGPGKHTLTTDNIPILTNLKSWKYALESPFKADVYYVVTRVFTGNKWGTANPVMMRDADFGIVRLRAYGTYDFRIVERRSS